MKLDPIQRTTLLNQYLILEKVDPKGGWSRAVEIFRNGYELEYDDYMQTDEAFSEELAREALDIMSMFRALSHAKSKRRFEGFDGNHPIEGRFMGYVRHLWEDQKFTESRHKDIDGGNSHAEYLGLYRNMVRAWKNDREYAAFPLTPEDVARIEAVTFEG